MVFCSIDVGVGGKVPFVVVCYRAVLKHERHEKHECHEGHGLFVTFALSCYS
jgi:hypothetical protein